MKTKTIITYTKAEILRLMQDDYNAKNKTNHALEYAYYSYHQVQEEVDVTVSIWNKDEETH